MSRNETAANKGCQETETGAERRREIHQRIRRRSFHRNVGTVCLCEAEHIRTRSKKAYGDSRVDYHGGTKQASLAAVFEPPSACDCADLSDGFPCWPCIRDGKRDLPD